MTQYKITKSVVSDKVRGCTAQVNIPIADMSVCCIKKGKVTKLNTHQTVTVEIDSIEYENIPVWIHTDVGSREVLVKGTAIAKPEDYFKDAALMFPYPGGVTTTWGTTFDPEVLVMVNKNTKEPLGIIQVVSSVCNRFPIDSLNPFPTYRVYGLFELSLGKSASGNWAEAERRWMLYDFSHDCFASIPTIPSQGAPPQLPFIDCSLVEHSNFSKLYNFLYEGTKTTQTTVGIISQKKMGDWFPNQKFYDSDGIERDPGYTESGVGMVYDGGNLVRNEYFRESIYWDTEWYFDWTAEISGGAPVHTNVLETLSSSAYGLGAGYGGLSEPIANIPYDFEIFGIESDTEYRWLAAAKPGETVYSNGIAVKIEYSVEANKVHEWISSGGAASTYYNWDRVDTIKVTTTYNSISFVYEYNYKYVTGDVSFTLASSGGMSYVSACSSGVFTLYYMHEIPFFAYSGANLIMELRAAGTFPFVQKCNAKVVPNDQGYNVVNLFADPILDDIDYQGAVFLNQDCLIKSSNLFKDICNTIYMNSWDGSAIGFPNWVPVMHPSEIPHTYTYNAFQFSIGLRVEGFYILPYDIREVML